MQIIDLDPGNRSAVEQAARLLMVAFRDTGCRDWLELHPLVVRSDRQGSGLGRALVED